MNHSSADLPRFVHLRRGGTSVVVQLTETDFPAILHWGADLGDVPAADFDSLAVASRPQRVSGGLDTVALPSLLPLASQGWQSEPGLVGSRASGTAFTPLFEVTGVEATSDNVVIQAQDHDAELGLSVTLDLGVSGVLRQRLSITNRGTTDYRLGSLSATFPLPSSAAEILDTTGRHLKERSPQRHALTIGEHVRTSRRGRPGADATLLLFAGEPGFGFRSGLVHAVHVAWSGDHRLAAVSTPTGTKMLSAGELLAPGEGDLQTGQSYETPWVIGTWGEGLDEAAGRLHDDLRARPTHPRTPRPVTLNTWEAVYFQQDLEHLSALADEAARIGVERFVLDDGWFRHRRDDTAGLGDWFVDEGVWPDGLRPLIDRVTALGLQFGLWVEPEMVNPDSDLARAHPDWILKPSGRWPMVGRHQQVLDVSHPEAFAYLLGRLDALLTENDIGYLKWDHNRDLIEAGHPDSGRPAVHDTTTALYALLDELRLRHPSVEIESCASGGARIDLGILQRTDRVWTSDCIDPLERLDIQAYTNLLVPYELLGAHVGADRSHSTHRTFDLDFQAITALFGHFGIESDLTKMPAAEVDRLAEWISTYKNLRGLFHSGRSVHADLVDPALDLRGVVSADRSHAAYAITLRAASVAYPAGRFVLPGLDPEGSYRIGLPSGWRSAEGPGQSELAWAEAAAAGTLRLTGRMLATVGLQVPVLYPAMAVLIEVSLDGGELSAARRLPQ